MQAVRFIALGLSLLFVARCGALIEPPSGLTGNSTSTYTGWSLLSTQTSLTYSGAQSSDFGSPFSNSKFMFSTWLKPNAASAGSVILGNSSNANGFELRHGATASEIEFVLNDNSGADYTTLMSRLSPAGWWRFNETSGTTAADSSGHGLDGTYAGSYTLGKSSATIDGNGSSVRLTSATSGRVELPTTAFTVDKTDSFSVSLWYKIPSSGQHQYLLSRLDSVTWQGIIIMLGSDGSPYAYLEDAAGGWIDIWPNVPSSDNQFHHLVMTYNGSGLHTGLVMYVDGQLISSVTSSGGGALGSVLPANKNLLVGTLDDGTASPDLTVDEIAVWYGILSPTQVASLYAARACRSAIDDGAWSFVSGAYDGTNVSLSVNGAQKCNFAMRPTYSPSSLAVGSRGDGTRFWKGSISSLKLYGDADNSTTSSSLSRSDFDMNLSTAAALNTANGIVLQLDAAQGLSGNFPGAGCAQTTWTDLSPFANVATLTGFASCGATLGWQGAGVSTDPYSLYTNATGADEYIEVTNSASLENVQESNYTIEAWVNPRSLPTGDCNVGANDCIYAVAMKQGWHEGLGFTTPGRFMVWHQLADHHASSPYGWGDTHAADAWYYVVTTISDLTVDLYVNGKLESRRTDATPTGAGTLEFNQLPWRIGIGSPGTATWRAAADMKFGEVRIYNRHLTLSEMRLNCLAKKSRYSGITCD